jgi:serine/threonine protein kinase
VSGPDLVLVADIGRGRACATIAQSRKGVGLAAGREFPLSGLTIGDSIAGYRIEAFLGRGGMGAVYLATHERLQRKVALKVLVPELAADEVFRKRFIRESQLAALLEHPNVIPIYDADEVDGLLTYRCATSKAATCGPCSMTRAG